MEGYSITGFLKSGIKIKKIVLLVGLFLAGCSTAPISPDRSDTGVSGTGAVPEDQKSQGTPVEAPPPKAPVLARDIEEKEPELPAVTYLLDQAEKALGNNEPDRASALSDRALQIDRKSPRAYLIIALSQLAEKKPDRAMASARQGLLYTSEKSEVGKQLKALIRH